MQRTLAFRACAVNTVTRIPLFAFCQHNHVMITNEETRLLNLRRLRAEAGTFVVLAERCQTSESYLSQIHNRLPDSNTGKAKNIGDRLARKLETGMQKPVGWMDALQGERTIETAWTAPKAHCVEEPAPTNYTDPRRRRLILAFEEMTDPQIEEMLSAAELTARTNREIEAAMAAKKKNAA